MSNASLINQDSGNKTWLTPRYIIDALGPFDTDPCCPKEMPWATASRMITEEENGLNCEWHGRVWLNPPYGKEAIQFLEKMNKHISNGGRGISLLWARTDTKAFQDFVFPFAKALFFIRGRLRFYNIRGETEKMAPTPSVLIAYTWSDLETLQRAQKKIGGYLLILK